MSVQPLECSALAARLLRLALAAFCLLLPIVAVLLPHWPVVVLWIAGLLLPLLAWLGIGQRPRPDKALLIWLAPLLVWALCSAIWALDARDALLLAPRSFATLLVALLLADCFNRLPPHLAAGALRWLLPGFALALLLLIEERLSGLAIMQRLAGVSYSGAREADHLNRSALGFALLGFAAALQLWLRGPRWSAFALLVPLTALLSLFASTTALLAAAVGVLLLGATLWRRSLGLGLLLVALLLALPLMPLIAWISGRLHLAEAAWLGLTGQSRAYIWDFVLDRIRERPILGWGMDASASMPNFGVTPFFKFQDHVIPLHPHSAGLQLWLELGLVGLLLALPPLLLLWQRLARTDRPGTPFLVAVAAAVLVAGGLSVGLWQSRWLGLECLALLLPLLVRRGGEA